MISTTISVLFSLVVVLSLTSSDGFLLPPRPQLLSTPRSPSTLSSENAFSSFIIADQDVVSSAIDGDVPVFADGINYLDGTVLTMFGVFGVVVAILIGFKLLTDQMDNAIVQVVTDFETTMKQYYPQRYQNDIQPLLLEKKNTESKQETLVKIMEDYQTKDPEFMNRVKEKMDTIR